MAAARAEAQASRVLSTAPVAAAAASNDVVGVRWALERDGATVDLLGDWCARRSPARGKQTRKAVGASAAPARAGSAPRAAR
jgi:hypothetical protein